MRKSKWYELLIKIIIVFCITLFWYGSLKAQIEMDTDEGDSTLGKLSGLIDEFINIENVIGTNFDDIIIGDENDNHLIGSNGNDKIYGRSRKR